MEQLSLPHMPKLQGQRLILAGKFAGMTKRDTQQRIRAEEGLVVDPSDASATTVVIGEAELLPEKGEILDLLSADVRQKVQRGECEIIGETQLWERLGLIEERSHLQRLYTPGMLADLLQVPIAVIRRWHRHGLIVPKQVVHRLPYFDYQEVVGAKRLAQLLSEGVSPHSLEKQLLGLKRFLPNAERSLAQLSIILQGKKLLFRQGEGLIDSGGQRLIDFDRPPAIAPKLAPLPPEQETLLEEALLAREPVDRGVIAARETSSQEIPPQESPEHLIRCANDLEDEGQLREAAQLYRAALAAGGADPGVCFALAEVLYRMGDLNAARERYFMAVELNEDYVEARANLGCVLAEQGEKELAISAFQGALKYHPDYPDAHYHLARLLDETGRVSEALTHWRQFIQLAPESPWAEEAKTRLR